MDYSPPFERKLVCSPREVYENDTVLFVTRDERRWYLECARKKKGKLEYSRTVYSGRSAREVAAWLAGNRWNPGGPIARPIFILAARR